MNAIILSCLPSGLWEQISRLQRLAPCLTQSCFRHSMQLGGRPCKMYTGWLQKAGLGWLSFFPSKLSFQNVSGNNKVSLRNLISCKANMSMKVSSSNLEGPSCRKSTVLTIMKGTQVLCTRFFFFAIHNKRFTQRITHVHGSTAYMLLHGTDTLERLYPKTWSTENELKLGWAHFPACQGLSLSNMPVVPESRIKLPFLEKYS